MASQFALPSFPQQWKEHLCCSSIISHSEGRTQPPYSRDGFLMYNITYCVESWDEWDQKNNYQGGRQKEFQDPGSWGEMRTCLKMVPEAIYDDDDDDYLILVDKQWKQQKGWLVGNRWTENFTGFPTCEKSERREMHHLKCQFNKRLSQCWFLFLPNTSLSIW